ncbi:hypothetical protein H5410_065022 [Solanum commersonii]|uniref:Uncharacterized protein n=1 Tax=Solanum commersonii TaxID=4109 RepID=A0A9J5VXQ7_SOLCO|nr:hypothetical protein H5410_065022 [Solanum commersonii]
MADSSSVHCDFILIVDYAYMNVTRREDKESKALIELREVRREAQEIHDEFLRAEGGQICPGVTRRMERLRSDLGELNLWIGDKKSGMYRGGKRKVAGPKDTC